MPGDHQGLLGDTLRRLGETSIGLGDHATAERQLRQSVTLARQGYGAAHPHALRAELSLARLQARAGSAPARSEEHTSELQSLMRISYAGFCLKKKKKHNTKHNSITTIQNYEIAT